MPPRDSPHRSIPIVIRVGQVRTHAQKYFLKQLKYGRHDSVNMGRCVCLFPPLPAFTVSLPPLDVHLTCLEPLRSDDDAPGQKRKGESSLTLRAKSRRVSASASTDEEDDDAGSGSDNFSRRGSIDFAADAEGTGAAASSSAYTASGRPRREKAGNLLRNMRGGGGAWGTSFSPKSVADLDGGSPRPAAGKRGGFRMRSNSNSSSNSASATSPSSSSGHGAKRRDAPSQDEQEDPAVTIADAAIDGDVEGETEGVDAAAALGLGLSLCLSAHDPLVDVDDDDDGCDDAADWFTGMPVASRAPVPAYAGPAAPMVSACSSSSSSSSSLSSHPSPSLFHFPTAAAAVAPVAAPGGLCVDFADPFGLEACEDLEALDLQVRACRQAASAPSSHRPGLTSSSLSLPLPSVPRSGSRARARWPPPPSPPPPPPPSPPPLAPTAAPPPSRTSPR
jgi:hypothetical protein